MRPYHLSHQPLKVPKPIIPNRRRNVRPLLALGLLLPTMFLAVQYQLGQSTTYKNSDSLQTRNAVIAKSLQKRSVDTLVGDFWRILPISIQAPSQFDVTPLQNCFTAQPLTASTAAPTGYMRHSFAYLLSSDLSQNALRSCTRDAVIATFGQPNSITIIAGTPDKPLEQLLYYSEGVLSSDVTKKTEVNDEFQASSANGLRPVKPDKLVNRTCPGHRTILQVVAHEDDDLLFMNPDLLQAIQRGDCVRTVYITAGDAGSSKFYWLGRERGSEAAYSLLSGTPDEWSGQTLKLGNRSFVTAVSPVSNGKLSLLYMHLPDGKPDGQGFATSNFESLGKLASGEKVTIQSVERQSVYSRDELINAIKSVMEIYHPDEVRTLRPINEVVDVNDHSDHVTVGQLTSAALQEYNNNLPGPQIGYYAGYPILTYPANIGGDDLAKKEAAFFVYARYDGAVCGSVEACAASGNYALYLQRQYRFDP